MIFDETNGVYYFQYDKLSREKGGGSGDASEREELLKKLRTFGQFATTKTDPAESISDEAKPANPSEDQPDSPQVWQ